MPSRSRSRNSSRLSVRNSSKPASILENENGGQTPLRDAAVQDETELIPRSSQSVPGGFPAKLSASTSPSEGMSPIPTTDGPVEEPASTGTRIEPTASGQRDRLPHKTFGLHTDQSRGQRPQGGLPMDYKQKYPEDTIYKETESNARVFHVYNDESQISDNDMVIEAGDNLDILLVFAGLFASVLTTFVVQTSQSLSPDKTDITNSLLRELISLQRASENGTSFDSIPAADTSFTASHSDIWVNSLWFVSLALSLSTALLAVVAKQWLHQYSSFISGTPRERALIRQFCYDGLEKWGVRLIIGLLPTILHVSLFLFMAGLVIFLFPLSNTLARIVAGIAGFVCATYIITNTLPLIFIQCPYRTPLSEIMNTFYGAIKMIPVILLLLVVLPWWNVLRLLECLGLIQSKITWIPGWVFPSLWRHFGRWSTPLKEFERTCANRQDKGGRPVGIAGALLWLGQTTLDSSAKSIVVEAMGSVYHPLLTSRQTSVREALEQQWTNTILPRIMDGKEFGDEDERTIERLMRGAFLAHIDLDTSRRRNIHCRALSPMLVFAAYNLTSRLHTEDGKWQDLSPNLVLRFLSERDDLLTELEAPMWIWWMLFIRAAGDDYVDDDAPCQYTEHIMTINDSDSDSHREKWLAQVNIPWTLRHTVREHILDIYNTERGTGIQWPVSPYAFTILSRFFLARARKFKHEPQCPFSTVSLVTFVVDNFSHFPDFWMPTGDLQSRIPSSSSSTGDN